MINVINVRRVDFIPFFALSGIAFGLGPDARTGVVFPGAANDNRRRA
jgi:hypothetical protein